ncbi:MAG: hypothetical protein JWO46_2808 [Nocardioidaceae bacterium]|nr:hypothetical protein [Nocardioidaceae bacterium]
MTTCFGLAVLLAITSATCWFAQRGGRESRALPLVGMLSAAFAILFAIAGVGMGLGD